MLQSIRVFTQALLKARELSPLFFGRKLLLQHIVKQFAAVCAKRSGFYDHLAHVELYIVNQEVLEVSLFAHFSLNGGVMLIVDFTGFCRGPVCSEIIHFNF